MTARYEPGLPSHYKQSALTPAQREEIRDRYLDGETASDLAIEFGCKVRSLQNWLPARNVRR